MIRNTRRNKRAQADSIMQNLKLRGIDNCKANAKKIRKLKQKKQDKPHKGQKEASTKSELSDVSGSIRERRRGRAKDETGNSNPTEPTEEVSSFCSLDEPKISEMFQNSLRRMQEKLKEVYGEGVALNFILSEDEKDVEGEGSQEEGRSSVELRECGMELSTEERLINAARLTGQVKSTSE